MAKLTRAELDALYHRATQNGPSRDRPILWASELLEVSRRTVGRWLAGQTSPSTAEVVRLRIAARTAELTRERERGEGVWAKILALFARGEREAVERAAEALRADRIRAAEDPFRWATVGAWLAARRELGMRTSRRQRARARRIIECDQEPEFYRGAAWLDRRDPLDAVGRRRRIPW